MPARLHRADIIGDVFGGAHPVHAALHRFGQEGRGVIALLRDGAAGVPTHAIPQAGPTGFDVARSRQWREIGLGAQIPDLGITHPVDLDQDDSTDLPASASRSRRLN
jgi:3,4-dihydroxy 2-butanone 4-phosphate synthase/GTP cyclohydrolase II